MKALSALFLFLAFNSSLYAQKSREGYEKIKKEIIKDFSNITAYNLTELVPFSSNRKWGLIDSKSEKTIIPPKNMGKSHFLIQI